MAHQPQNLVATPVSTTEITLSWDDVESLESESYDIERDGIVVDNHAGTHTIAFPYSDTGLQPDTEYTYRVRAVGGTTATPPPPMGNIGARVSIFTPVVSATAPNVNVTPTTVAAVTSVPTATVTIPDVNLTSSTVVTASTILTPTVTIPFNPTSITGLVAWYDFSDVSTLWKDTGRTSAVTADADVIKGVTDLSGNAKHLSEATNGPTYKTGIQNSLSVARFDGSNDLLTGSDVTNQPFTVLVVGKATSAANNRYWMSLGGANQVGIAAVFDNYKIYAYNGAALGGSGASAPNGDVTNFHHHAYIIDSTSSKLYYDGGAAKASGDGGSQTPTTVVLGNHSTVFFECDQGEVLIYNTALSLGDLNSIGEYLETKWGVTWTTAT